MSAVKQKDIFTEIIVVVDGGSDSTLNIVQRISEQESDLKVIVKTNGGVSSARNEGLKHVTTEYVMFLDGDDELLPNACKYFLNAAKSTGADIVVSDYYTFREGSRVKKYKSASSFQPMSGFEFALKILEPKSTVSVWNKCFKRALFEGVTFPENITIGEDLVTLFSLSLKARLVVPMTIPTLVYLVRDQSLVNSKSLHLLTITTAMKMLKLRIESVCKDNDQVEGLYSLTCFYHVMYSRVVCNEKIGFVHYRIYKWYINEFSEESVNSRRFIKTLPIKERILIFCYRSSYHLAALVVWFNSILRILLIKRS